ncbi:MAG: hypothetical protein FWH21_02985 [Kiritimatiellaeota bacterium]|nr:hypothetical protein [Kiritimatiellota bacterium]
MDTSVIERQARLGFRTTRQHHALGWVAAAALTLLKATTSGAVPPGYIGISDWHDLRAIDNAPSANYFLVCDLTTNGVGSAGYDTWVENASDTYGTGWKPINALDGIFDGNGKTINGLWCAVSANQPVGLFAGLSGTVKNLTIVIPEDKRIESTGTMLPDIGTGALAGFMSAGTACVEDITVTGGDASGGVVGYNYVGGIVGRVSSGTLQGKISNAANVRATGNYGGNGNGMAVFAGGIVGEIYGNGWFKPVASETVLENTGNVSMESSGWAASGVGGIGGIAGRMASAFTHVFDGQTADNATVRIISTGNVHVRQNAGGVFGLLNVSNCTLQNYGNTAEVSGDGDYDAGGLVGRAHCNQLIIKNCYNAGAIHVTSYGSSSAGGWGGLIGMLYTADDFSTAALTDVYNLDSVSGPGFGGNSGTGGIVGKIATTTPNNITITRAFNAGCVLGSSSGAIVDSSHYVWTDCYYDQTTTTWASDPHATPLSTTVLIAGLPSGFTSGNGWVTGSNGAQTYPYFAWQLALASHKDVVFESIDHPPDTPHPDPSIGFAVTVTGANTNDQRIFNTGYVGGRNGYAYGTFYTTSPQTIWGDPGYNSLVSVGVMTASDIVAFTPPVPTENDIWVNISAITVLPPDGNVALAWETNPITAKFGAGIAYTYEVYVSDDLALPIPAWTPYNEVTDPTVIYMLLRTPGGPEHQMRVDHSVLAPDRMFFRVRAVKD